VDLDLTPDQRLFRSSAAEFLDRTMPVAKVRELADGDGLEREWWRRGAELGWTAMLVPEELGGGTVSGSAMADLVIVAEELGRHCAPGPLATSSAVLAGLLREADRFAETIGAVAAGESVAAWAWYEPDRGLPELPVSASPTEAPRTRLRADGTGYRLSGVKDRVEAGERADVFLVTAQGPEGLVQVLVAADAPGVTVRPTWTLDLVRRTAQVAFADVAVGPEAVVSQGEAAVEAVAAQLDVAATVSAAEIAGAAERAFELTLQWLFDRYSFGRPLASYQALKHRMADCRTWLEACHATAAAAARAIDDDPGRLLPATSEAVSVAKSYVGAKAPAMIQEFVQLHGGIGVTWEHDLHLYLRRATYCAALYGTPSEHRRRIVDLMERAAAA
jgi:alkylation response protein AidB-like acyl-CoA dehydrogenase